MEKEVTVMLELRARFDEEANLEWKERLELEGVKVLVGLPNKKYTPNSASSKNE